MSPGYPNLTSWPSGWVLTPQELEIARLAAAGLSNKQIAARLFMSHRTVGCHRYRIFPKLGITFRRRSMELRRGRRKFKKFI